MLGIIYLILAGILGYKASKILIEEGTKFSFINRIWLTLPASFGVGTLLLTWVVYIISWFFSVIGKVKNPLLYGNAIGMAGVLIFIILIEVQKYRSHSSLIRSNMEIGLTEQIDQDRKLKKKSRKFSMDNLITDKSRFKKELILFGLLAAFITYMMFYVFYMKDGILYSGLTVYGDYAPHTAMIRSFSMGNNFPTQYPHYGGADVKYHFMFQFLAGNLEYLGMRMDVAYNIVSLTSLTGFLMLLYQLALRITGKMCCGVLTIFLFFFRSGMAFFRFVWEHIQAGNLLETLTENVSFIGYTTNENWGLWNFNVYLNQRHLAFGLLMVTLALYLFMDWLEAGTMHEEKGFVWMKKRLFSKEGWRSRNLEQALLMGLFLGLCAFWNGAAVIGGLLILCGFAVFSDGKLDYLIMAAVTIFFSYLQTKIFISGSAMSPQIYLGFLAEDKTVWGVVQYLFWMSGVFFLGLLVLVWFMRRRERAILLGFIFPTIFAFVLLMTPDINVNHKYIMISYAFLTIFWAWTICNLWTGERVNRNVQIADERKTEDIENEIKKETSQSDVKTGRDRKIRKFAGKVLAAILTICLSITGIYDFAVIVKGNGPGRRVAVNMNSDLTCWLAEHLDKNDLLLTPEYSMNEVTMSGVMLYCGWPYYAWSAGYDTNYRAAQAVTIYTTSDSETLKSTVKQEKITYILFEEGSEFEQQVCQEETIAATYEKVYETQDGRIRIYKTN
ncbi:hypothetical protein [Blautia sp. HCN-1074]|jgi:hypothetical protein|uniref:hypothetical protein n=1 Tax=Blautia sp. HCN-1074 TaxID=3134667 RepID=UPI0030C00CCF